MSTDFDISALLAAHGGTLPLDNTLTATPTPPAQQSSPAPASPTAAAPTAGPSKTTASTEDDPVGSLAAFLVTGGPAVAIIFGCYLLYAHGPWLLTGALLLAAVATAAVVQRAVARARRSRPNSRYSGGSSRGSPPGPSPSPARTRSGSVAARGAGMSGLFGRSTAGAGKGRGSGGGRASSGMGAVSPTAAARQQRRSTLASATGRRAAARTVTGPTSVGRTVPRPTSPGRTGGASPASSGRPSRTNPTSPVRRPAAGHRPSPTSRPSPTGKTTAGASKTNPRPGGAGSGAATVRAGRPQPVRHTSGHRAQAAKRAAALTARPVKAVAKPIGSAAKSAGKSTSRMVRRLNRRAIVRTAVAGRRYGRSVNRWRRRMTRVATARKARRLYAHGKNAWKTARKAGKTSNRMLSPLLIRGYLSLGRGLGWAQRRMNRLAASTAGPAWGPRLARGGSRGCSRVLGRLMNAGRWMANRPRVQAWMLRHYAATGLAPATAAFVNPNQIPTTPAPVAPAPAHAPATAAPSQPGPTVRVLPPAQPTPTLIGATTVAATPDDITDAFDQWMAGFDPENVLELQQHFNAFAPMLERFAAATAQHAQRLQDEYELKGPVVDMIQQFGSAFAGMTDLAEDVVASWRAEHEPDIERHESPRTTEWSFWSKQSE
ncbi:hypothetical protein [Streptomyces sp. NPDC059076]|uniref:hypothetical protein n=1 Tax=unclassified Streptomyces TaxID=2593676 RepID=UPI0036C4CE27